jgi:acetylornithine deacetylase/succinyl-diaminopimelate desuccinylase-like protein
MRTPEHWFGDNAAQAACASLQDSEPIIQTTIAIQQIPAPTFHELQRGQYVQTQMAALGLADVTMDEIGNVYGRRPGSGAGPGLLIAAHLDTVFAADTDLTVRRENGRVYGPGIGDNSLGVAALLHLAQTLQQHHVAHHGDIWFVANVGEEGMGDLRGMRAAVERLRHCIAAAIALEGGTHARLLHEALGVQRYRISADAPGGHSWADFGAPSAVHALVRLAARLTQLDAPNEPRSSFNIGVIEGGSTVNSIAQHASLLLDLRSTDMAALDKLVRQVERIFAQARTTEHGVTLNLEQVGNRPAGRIPRDHPLVRAAAAAYRTVGTPIEYDIGSTDANIPLSFGIPALCVGVTDANHAHRLDEYIETARIPAGMQALLWLSLAATSRDG